MFTFLDHWQELEGAQERRVIDSTNIKETISMIGSRIDAEAGSIGRAGGNRHQNVALFWHIGRVAFIQAEFEPGATVIAKEQLLERSRVIEPGPAHKRKLLHSARSNGDIGIDTNAERIGKIAAIDFASID